MGQGATRAELLEAMAQEYIGEHPVEAGDEDDTPVKEPFRPRNPFANMEARLEVETQQWACLPTVPDSFVPDAAFEETASAEEIDAELRRLAAMRSSWDDALGHAALAVKASGMWAILGFATYEHYCAERLGLAARAAEQRAALERRLWQVPALREALLSRQLSYEQVRLLSRLPDPDIPAWIPRARELTCIELRRALERNEDAQLRAAGSFAAPLPRRIALTLFSAFRAVRAVENPLWGDGRCLVAIARHFLETWKPAREEAEDPVAAGPGARSRQLPGPDVQPQGRARAPRPVQSPARAERSIPTWSAPAPVTTCAASTRATSASPAPRPTGSSGSWAGRCGWGPSGGGSRGGRREPARISSPAGEPSRYIETGVDASPRLVCWCVHESLATWALGGGSWAIAWPWVSGKGPVAYRRPKGPDSITRRLHSSCLPCRCRLWRGPIHDHCSPRAGACSSLGGVKPPQDSP